MARSGAVSSGWSPTPAEQVGEEVDAGVRAAAASIDSSTVLPARRSLTRRSSSFLAVNWRVTPSAVPSWRCAVCLALEELLGDGGVVLGAFDRGGEDQRGELGLVHLAVAVDAAVALLDPDQRPGQVVVDEVVALRGACSRPRRRRRR